MPENPILKRVDVKEIVKKYLEDNGYGGLCNCEGDCGCTLDDLMPCYAEGVEHCQAGYRVLLTAENIGQYEDCEAEIGDWITVLEKPKA
jgi:hypothetical protein